MEQGKKHYERFDLAALAELVEKASESSASVAKISLEDLEARLLDVFDAVLGPQSGEFKAYWQDAGERDLPHRELAILFEEATEADDPFSIVNLDNFARTELKVSFRKRWASKANRTLGRSVLTKSLPWYLLSRSQQDDVRNQLRDLARFHWSRAVRGAASNDALNTILFELATVFVTLTGLDNHEYELPHAPTSYFIRFTELATGPFFDLTVVTPAALSNRWKRQKQAHHTKAP